MNNQQQGGYMPPNQNQNQNQNQNNMNVPTNNQSASPQEIENLEKSLKTNSQWVACPFCRNQGMTRTITSCSVCNFLCCFFTGAIPWVIFQACRSKDMNCNDAEHYCSRCGNRLANYTAC